MSWRNEGPEAHARRAGLMPTPGTRSSVTQIMARVRLADLCTAPAIAGDWSSDIEFQIKEWDDTLAWVFVPERPTWELAEDWPFLRKPRMVTIVYADGKSSTLLLDVFVGMVQSSRNLVSDMQYRRRLACKLGGIAAGVARWKSS